MKQKLETVAVLRCLGSVSWQTVSIYLIQAMAMSLLGTLIGAVIGIGLQYVLPIILVDFLPISIDVHLSLSSILQAAAVSLGITLNFALLPLLPVRRISPLLALRSAYETDSRLAKDPLRWLIYVMIIIGVSIFSVVQIKSPDVSWWYGLLFPLGVGVVVLLLAAFAQLFIHLLRRFFPERSSYVWRQGLANLFRPNNQSVVLVLSVGLGAFFISTLYFTQNALLSQIALSDKNGQPNLVLFDIQADQKKEVEALVASEAMPIMQNIPIVTMRFSKVKNVQVADLNRDSSGTQAYFWEYRTTYRDTLDETESILAGKFHGRASKNQEVVDVSLAEFLTKRLNVGVNDTLVFDVQGVPITALVSSIRKINFTRIQPSFSIVFPTGVLEDAPQFFALVTRAKSSAESARLQQKLVQAFPNVSAIDLELIVTTLDDVLSKISLVIRFMALFSIATGFTVLAGAVMTSRYQRVKESVLLRSLGAMKRQVVQVMIVEYFFLGSLAAVVGVGLALLSSWALAHFFFSIDFSPSIWPIFLAIGLVVGTTVLIGVWVSRGIHARSPLEVLRAETL
ncbi:ABC transporter permease [Chloroherpeton thalassium]